MISQQASYLEKVALVKGYVNKYPAMYQNDIVEFLSRLSNSDLKAYNIKIQLQTLYKLSQPAFASLQWDEPYEQNLYPVTLVIAHKIEENSSSKTITTTQFGYKLKLITWIQSGGTRCIGITPNLHEKVESEIQKMISLTHCCVITDLGESEQVKKWLSIFFDISKKQQSYPILSLGKSILSLLPAIDLQKKFSYQKQQNGLAPLFISHDSELFSGLQLYVRLPFQYRRKVCCPIISLREIDNFTVAAGTISKTGAILPMVLEDKQRKIFFILTDTWSNQSAESIELWHRPILNFINLSKKKKKQVDEKRVDKILIAQLKLVHYSNEAFFKQP